MTIRLRLAILAVLLLASACMPGEIPSAVPASGAPGSPVVGVLTGVDSEGLSSVKGFSLRTDDGRALEFRLGVLENGDEFPVGHLGEHLASSEPVRVWFHEESGELVAYRIEDAGG